jgi:hypothetical protein
LNQVFCSRSFISLDVLVGRASNHAIGASAFLYVCQALLISGELLMRFADVHSFFQSVRSASSSTISSNRWSRRSCSAAGEALFLPTAMRFASRISAISSLIALTRSDTGFCTALGSSAYLALVFRFGSLRVLRLMEVHAGWTENIAAHLTGFSVGIAQFHPTIRTLLAGSFRAGNAISICQISDLNDFAAAHFAGGLSSGPLTGSRMGNRTSSLCDPFAIH